MELGLAAVLAGWMETVVGQLGMVELEAVGKPGLMLRRRQVAAKTAEVFQLGRGTVGRQLPGWRTVVQLADC